MDLSSIGITVCVRDARYQFSEALALIVALRPPLPLLWFESIIATGPFQQSSVISLSLTCLKQTVD